MTDPRDPTSRWSDGRVYAATIDRQLSGLRDYVSDHLPDGERVLDACCGTGALAVQLAQQGRRVMGVDLSRRHIEYARRSAEEAGVDVSRVHFEIGDVAHLARPAAGPFDVAVIVLALHEMPADTRPAVVAALGNVATRLLIVDFAIPMPKNRAGIRNRATELIAGPKHYSAFRDYARRGGLTPLLDANGLVVEHERRIDADTLHIIHLGPDVPSDRLMGP